MNKLIMAFGLILMCTLNAAAQSMPQDTPAEDKNAPRFRFLDGETHDFGTVEDGPDAVYLFKFKNVGKAPLIITNVNTTDGATVADWSKAPVLPGKSGGIRVVFHTAGKTGSTFIRTIHITSNAVSANSSFVLSIKGNVVAKLNTPPLIDHPVADDKNAPRFLFPNGTTHDFGTVEEGPNISYEFLFKNAGKQPLIISGAICDGGSVPEYSKEPVPPGQTGFVRAWFHTEGRAGQPFQKTIRIRSNAVSERGDYDLIIKGVVAWKMPEKNEPRFLFPDGATHNFGIVEEGPDIRHIFKFKNTGKQPLIIMHVQSDGGAVANWSNSPVMPGKSGEIEVTFHTSGKVGQQFERAMRITSNTANVNLIISGFITRKDAADKNAPRFLFLDGETHDFGVVEDGPVLSYFFTFKNIGRTPLIISNVASSGGGASAGYSKLPVAPGKKGQIEVLFHTSGKAGQLIDKTLWITSNAVTEGWAYQLSIKGRVVQKIADTTQLH